MTVSEAFWKIHTDLPRQAPGSDNTTQHLLLLAGNPTGKALDIGCGQGRASLLLAQRGLTVIATDTFQPFLDELQGAAVAAGLREIITTRNISMDALDYPDESFDVLWAEGSAYILGWKRAISSWQRLIKPGGLLVATECCWLTDEPSNEARQFWAEGYLTMLSAKAAVDVAAKNGYGIIATYTLPASDWFDEYYGPMKEKHAGLAIDADDSMEQAITSGRKEIELYEKYGDEYGYVGFVLKNN